MTYPAIFHETDNSGYWVEFPDFKGGTQGDTLDEAMEEAKEFLAGFLAHYIDNEQDFPTPTDINKIKADDGFTTMIQADPTPYVRGNNTIRKNVSIPEWLVKRAQKEHINFSKVLTEALMKTVS
jgi:predicted RNase H-like HicB family nuclease